MIARLTLLVSAAVLSLTASCQRDIPEIEASWTDAFPGIVSQHDGGLLVFDGFGVHEIDNDILCEEQSPFATKSIFTQPGLHRSKWNSSVFVTDGADRMLMCKEKQFQLALIREPVEFTALPATQEYLSLTMLHVRNADWNMCFLGETPVALHWQQQAAAYDDNGEIIWTLMSGPWSYMMAADDGQHLAVCSFAGLLQVVDRDGQPVWQLDGSKLVRNLGDSLLVLDYPAHTLSAYDWQGGQLWQKSDIEIGKLVQLAVNQLGGPILLTSDSLASCYDRQGSLLWQEELPAELVFPPVLAADGHSFFSLRRDPAGKGTIGGRRLGYIKPGDHYWLCLDPQGQPLWRSHEAPAYSSTILPLPGGVLLLEESNSLEFSCYRPPSQ